MYAIFARFFRSSSPSAARLRASAIAEIALFLAIALVADSVWGAGDRFRSIEPHPFWAVVLLMAAQYGTIEALMATALSTAALLVGQWPVQRFDQTVQEHALEIVLLPMLWMMAAVVLGELRARHRQEFGDATDRLREAERQVGLLTTANADLSATNERLETRLAGQLRTAAGVLQGARELETLDPRRVLAGATDLLRAALDAKAFSLFLLKGDHLALVAADGWGAGRSFPERYDSSHPLFQAIVGGQRFLSVATPDGERMLDGHGVMAGPLIDPAGGTIFGMLKVDQMRFIDFNLSSVQTFRAVTEWIAAAYANAIAHQDSQVEDHATRLLGMKHLDRQLDHLAAVARRFDFDLTALSFHVHAAGLSEGERRQIPALMADAAREVLRGTDLVFSHQPPGTQFVIVLPGATPESAVAVSQKLVAALHAACGYEVPSSTQIRSLCAARTTPMRREDLRPGDRVPVGA